MWIRLWARASCGSGQSSQEDHYIWIQDPTTSDELLDDNALSFMESTWIRDQDRRQWGFERLTVLPEDVRVGLIRRYEGQIQHAQRMLVRLGDLAAGDPSGSKVG